MWRRFSRQIVTLFLHGVGADGEKKKREEMNSKFIQAIKKKSKISTDLYHCQAASPQVTIKPLG